jgi:hypothetical protein
MALSVMKATLARAAAVLGLGVVVALVSPTGFLLLLSSALAYVSPCWRSRGSPGAAPR